MTLFIIFVTIFIIVLGILIYNIFNHSLYHDNAIPIFLFLVISGGIAIGSYIDHKVGSYPYLINDYGMKFDDYKKGGYVYTKDTIIVKMSTSNFNRTAYGQEKLNNNLDTKLHYHLLMRDYKFDKKTLNLIFEYLTEDPDVSKEIYFQGDHRHITIKYSSEKELLYYEVTVEYRDYTSGEETKKNPNYDKYEDYHIVFKDYNEDDMIIYEKIVTGILGDNYRKKGLDYSSQKHGYQNIMFYKDNKR